MDESLQSRFATDVVRALRERGRQALWAGGCVRDRLLGKTPKDYDVATDAPPEEVRTVFGRRNTVAVGASFGVVTVLGAALGRREAAPIEVATFRSDGAYTDGRRPDGVRFSSPEEDAQRRDFTINGLFYDPIEDRVIDYVEGRRDLAAGVVRAIGDADARFAEDRLRMLRAVRFASTLGFVLDESTFAAVRRHAGALPVVSAERIGAEIKRMLVEQGRGRALGLLAETGLLAAVFPRLPVDAAWVGAAAQRLDRFGALSPALALAALVVGVESNDGGAIAMQLARELRWTAKESERAGWLVRNANALEEAADRPWSRVQPLLAHPGGLELVALRRAITGAADPTDAFCRERLAWPADRLDPPPLVTGADLVAAGLRPGPPFAAALNRARRAQLDGLAATREDALRFALGAQAGE